MTWLLGIDDPDDIPAGFELTEFVAGLADAWDDTQRQKLIPYLPRVALVRTDYLAEGERAARASQWIRRTWTPAWYRLAGLPDDEDERYHFDTDPAPALEVALRRDGHALDAAIALIGKSDARRALDMAKDATAQAFDTSGWQAVSRISSSGQSRWDRAVTESLMSAVACEAAAKNRRSGDWHREADRVAADEALTPTVRTLQSEMLALLEELIAV